MAAIRKETLDIIHDELTHPSTFLKQMLDSSKTGMVSLNIVQQMSKDLCKIPLDYLAHCLVKDQDRFAYDSVETRVCLQSQLKTHLTKTTPFGTIDPEDDEDDDPTTGYPDYETPFFRPMFSISEKVFPIFFDNDTFYVDDLPEKQVNAEKPNIDVPEHVVCSIEPLTNNERQQTVLHTGLVECFNCGARDHIFSNCPEPTDLKRINRKKRELKRSPGRLYEELEKQGKREVLVPGSLSAALRDALDMGENQEPPYYRNMRIYGYPPGYLVNADPSKPLPTFQSVYQNEFDETLKELKIYDDAYIESDDEEKKEEEEEKEPKETVEIRLVDYGIEFNLDIDTSKLDTAMQQYHSITPTYNSSNHIDTNEASANTNNYQYYPAYTDQSTANTYAYYYSGYYDYSGYEQYNNMYPPPADALPPPPPPPPPSATLSPPPPSSPQMNTNLPSNQTLTPNNEQTQPNTTQTQVPSYNDDNDSVDMDISDDDM